MKQFEVVRKPPNAVCYNLTEFKKVQMAPGVLQEHESQKLRSVNIEYIKKKKKSPESAKALHRKRVLSLKRQYK